MIHDDPPWVPCTFLIHACSTRDCLIVSTEDVARVRECGASLQPVEGIMCMFKDTLKSRLVKLTDLITKETTEVVVDPDVQCRGCVSTFYSSGKLLVRDSCIAKKHFKQSCG